MVEATGSIDENGRIQFDAPIELPPGQRELRVNVKLHNGECLAGLLEVNHPQFVNGTDLPIMRRAEPRETEGET